MSVETPFPATIDGRPARSDDLGPLAFSGYAHFTAMQVRGARIRGLDLHLDRLRTASLALFGQALADDEIRMHLKQALRGHRDCSMTATVYVPGGEFAVPDAATRPRVLVRTGPAASGPEGPLDLAVVEHERFMPELKHVGESAKTFFLRQAVSQGFGDAAFVDRHGRLSEATIWNLAFWDGESVVWPQAGILVGTTMGIVRRQLRRMGVGERVEAVRVSDLPALKGAVVMNSWTPGIAIRRLGSHEFATAPDFTALLHRAFANEEPVAP